MKMIILAGAALLLATAADAQSANPAGADPISGDEVYKAFHEQAGIDRIIDDFTPRIAADARIARRFQDADMPHLNAELKVQVCYLIGGPCKYSGEDMKTAHKGMGLRNDEFNALAEDLQLSMNKEKVSFQAQNKLLAKLAPMQRDIVTK